MVSALILCPRSSTISSLVLVLATCHGLPTASYKASAATVLEHRQLDDPQADSPNDSYTGDDHQVQLRELQARFNNLQYENMALQRQTASLQHEKEELHEQAASLQHEKDLLWQRYSASQRAQAARGSYPAQQDATLHDPSSDQQVHPRLRSLSKPPAHAACVAPATAAHAAALTRTRSFRVALRRVWLLT